MNEFHLPDEVQEFKRFIQSRHGIVDDVKNGKYSWQELFDKWKHTGDNDSFWEDYEPVERKSNSHDYLDKFSNVFELIGKIDFDQLEKQVNQLSKTIDQVQKFMKNKNHQPPFQYNQRKRFF